MGQHSVRIRSAGLALLIILGLAGLSACTRSSSTGGETQVPTLSPAGSLEGSSTPIAGLDPNHHAQLVHIGATTYVLAHGVISEPAFDELHAGLGPVSSAARQAAVSAEVTKIAQRIQQVGGLIQKRFDEVGFVSFLLPISHDDLLGSLKHLQFDRQVLFAPDLLDVGALRDAKAYRPSDLGFEASPAGDTSAFSGLKRIGAPEFVTLAEQAINSDGVTGVKVNGSKVFVGITDTGITYNHPTFLSKVNPGQNRITYLKDFTKEGRVYFNSAATFAATDVTPVGGTPEVEINAQIIETPRRPTVPAADKFREVTGLKLKVSPALQTLLLAPNASNAKLGLLREDAFQAEGEPVDINANGKLDDELVVLYLPGASADQDVIYFDPSGKHDLTQAVALGDWNTHHSMVKVFAEKVGFHFEKDKLPKESNDQETVEVQSVSIVGFDPGNHGSHVAGIAAGLKTIANDPDDTLARGVAPEAAIQLNRVCANNGGCAATEAFTDLAMNAGSDVINMSLGGLSPLNDGYGTQETMVNRLSSLKNVLFVISAGNSGPGKQTLGSPSTARLSLSVGASASKGLIQRQYEWPGGGAWLDPADDQEFMLFFSSRGPTAAGGFKPNLSAPGTELSSIQLNAAPGAHAGLDVYWGTSMAAPTATGAYALLLDGVRKFNDAHPASKLPTDVVTLRQALISSAIPFDVDRLDPVTKEHTEGQYIWTDQGTGLINLPAAWKAVFAARDSALPTAVHAGLEPVELDYEVVTSMKTTPASVAYDGTRPTVAGPAFGTGVYLSATSSETFFPVHLARRLPSKWSQAPEAGDLHVQLVTTQDEFALRTTFYGSAKEWLKVGVLNALDCANSPTQNLKITSQGATISVDKDGKGTLAPDKSSTLNLCLDRDAIATLPAGDHGALIEAFRVVKGSAGVSQAALPSFTVPVYLTVPHRSLEGGLNFEAKGLAKSFDVKRHYVNVPEGTSVVTFSLEVPEKKAGVQGCAGVELMALIGDNSTKPFSERPKARAANCAADGSPTPEASKRSVSYSKHAPKAGIWDLHVFGQYAFLESNYTLKVDYLRATSTLKEITGDLTALKGAFDWSIQESSYTVSPEGAQSTFELTGFYSDQTVKISEGDQLFVKRGSDVLRTYTTDTKEVTVTTGGATGSDLDLYVLECDATASDASDKSCKKVGESAGSTDVESVTFEPKAGKVYAVRVDGFAIQNQTADFTFAESITLNAIEKGVVTVTGAGPYHVEYEFPNAATSPILSALSGDVKAKGVLELKSSSGALLESLPVRIKKP